VIKQGKKTFHSIDVVCLDCGLIYKNPMLTAESLDRFYDGHYINLYKPGHVAGISKTDLVDGAVKATYVLDFLHDNKIDLEGSSILEVGTGLGVLLKGLHSMGAKVTGIDMDVRSCEVAQKIFSLGVEHKGLFDMDESTKYDFVVSCNTLEHFHSPKQALQKMRSLLKDNGFLFIETPSYLYPYPHLIIDGFLSSAHNYTFSQGSFVDLAAQVGLRVCCWGYTGHHKSMQFLLSKAEGNVLARQSVDYDALLERFDACDATVGIMNALVKELFPHSNVDTISQRVLKELPYTSNHAFLFYAPILLQYGRFQDVITLMDLYNDSQPEDIERCRASSYHFKGNAYRQMGDFLEAKKWLKKAKERYPQFDRYNFIQELKVEGLIADSNLAKHLWWSNQKCLEEIS
jgi:2-polyprenyl-3-methyl-5-hydroxy-6-metoxy-1,4-benzoquinol methylase